MGTDVRPWATRGDILMFTTRNAARPFVGRYVLNAVIRRTYAAIRRGRGGLVPPRQDVAPPRLVGGAGRGSESELRQSANPIHAATFYANNDISVRLVNGQLVPNSLGDLTKRENRFAHPVRSTVSL